MYSCPYCKKTLKSARGVTQHINQTPKCLEQEQQQISAAASKPNPTARGPHSLRRSQRRQSQAQEVADPSEFASQKFPPKRPDQNDDDIYYAPDDASTDASQAERLPTRAQRSGTVAAHEDPFNTSSSEEEDSKPHAKVPPNTEMLRKFREYCDEHQNEFLSLTKEDKSSIKLMNALRKKALLHAYELVLEWHLKEIGKLKQHERLGDAVGYHHRQTLMKHLFPRYNLTTMIPTERKIQLPSSKAVVSIPVRDAADCIVSLLTDPRFQDADYLFFDDDPLASPPENITYLADLNTGDAYLRTYEKLIEHDRQVLLPIPIYIDGAVTGQFTDLPVTAVKLSLGIHTREARDRQYSWRELGFIPVVRKDPARGKRIFQETGHLDSEDVIVLEGEGETGEQQDADEEDNESEDGAVHAQDFHTMLSTILESFVELQRTGFIWDLVYKGKLYKGIEFVPFVPFVKCDTEEADLLCGKYLVRNKNVKHICRYCHCPTEDADNPLAKYPLKTQPQIQKLVEKAKLAELQAISQQYIQNAWYDVQFHLANNCGIHGACPSEKLHAIQLGIFKYLRDIFFNRMGKTSELAETINGLAAMYGKLLSRQSERDLPNTNFAKGIRKGKLMARDYRGVLLIMAATLRSEKGRSLLLKRKSLGGENGLRDWSLLVELMLEWEAFLCQKRMLRKDVVRLAKKHRFLMYIMRQVAKRSKGMGLKIMKFHAILHLITDILLYGVPTEFDTGSNESHHKESTHAARLTQRKESTFNYQTAKRLAEFLCIDLAMEEIENDNCVWDYFRRAVDEFLDDDDDDNDDRAMDATMEGAGSDSGIEGSDLEGGEAFQEANAVHSDSNEELEIATGGTRIKVFEDPDQNGAASFEFISRSKTIHGGQWMQEIVDWLLALQKLVAPFTDEPFLPILTQHQRGPNIFYGHPNFRSSGPWKDWVLIDWEGYGILPSHIWCFVRLEDMPIGKEKLEYGGITLTDGVFAVVEVADYLEDEEQASASDLFIPLTLDVKGINNDGVVTGRKFYLANTDAFEGPCCVIPNIGGEPNSYFQVKPRGDWSDLFVQWLRAPHENDVIDLSDEEEPKQGAKQPKKRAN